MLLGGFFTFILVVVLSASSERIFALILADVLAESDRVAGLLKIVLVQIKTIVLRRLLFHAIVVGIIGLVLIVVGWLVGRRTPKAGRLDAGGLSTPVAPTSTPNEEMPRSSVPTPPPVSPMPSNKTLIEDEDERPSGIFG